MEPTTRLRCSFFYLSRKVFDTQQICPVFMCSTQQYLSLSLKAVWQPKHTTMSPVFKCSTSNHASSLEVLYIQQYLSPTLKCSKRNNAYSVEVFNTQLCLQCWSVQHATMPYTTVPPVLKFSTHNHAIHNHAPSFGVFNTQPCHTQPCPQLWSVQHTTMPSVLSVQHITMPYTTMPPVLKCSTHYNAINNHASSL